MERRASKRIYRRSYAVNSFALRVSLIRLNVAGGIVPDGDVVGLPRKTGVAPVREVAADHQPLKLFRRFAQRHKALTNRNHRNPYIVADPKRCLLSRPRIKRDFDQIESLRQRQDITFNKPVVNDFSESSSGGKTSASAVKSSLLERSRPR